MDSSLLKPRPLPPGSKKEIVHRYLLSVVWFVVLTSLFAVAYNQSPLYTSNQNQYFLHGYAQAGVGTLSEDWLANTSDPTPVFSLLVAVTIRLFHVGDIFFIYYAFLMGVYLFSLIGIIEKVISIRSSKLSFHIFVVSIIVIHSTLVRYLLQRFFGGEWPYLFEGGVAGQRLLGNVFQPSTFGVFLLLSIYLYLYDRKVLAVLSAALAATFHPTYLLSAGALTLAYFIDIWLSRRTIWPAMGLSLFSLATVAPILIYTYVNFWGSNPAIAESARDILVNVRIPPHAIFSNWFNATVVVKLIFLAIGLFLVRRHRLFILLIVPLSLSIILTVIQVLLKNNALALLFPWRLSTWLVPVSVGLFLAKLITLSVPRMPFSLARIAVTSGYALIGLVMAAGIVRTYLENVEWKELAYRPVEAYVAAHRQVGQVYLIPPKLYDFRLVTSVPIYVDFESIPYKDSDVLEWYDRYRAASYFYQKPTCGQLTRITDQGVTDLVLPVSLTIDCPQMQLIYIDSAYRLYTLSQ